MNADVLLRVEGSMPEKLIRRALEEGACFRSIFRESARSIRIETDARSAEILIQLCERYSLPCKVLARRGQDAMLRRLRRRATLLAGLVTFAFAMTLFASRIWRIEVQPAGNRSADVGMLEEALAELGIYPGMAKSRVDASALEGELAAVSPNFSFVGVKVQGVRLLVEVSPAVAEPNVYEIEGGRDLVAQCDGVVESVEVLSGVACVKPGDTVLRGQTLIRGDERVSAEESRSIAALGTVIARTWHEGVASMRTTRTEEIETGRFSQSAEISLLGLRLPLTESETFLSEYAQVETLPIGGLFLPLEIRRTTHRETVSRAVEIDRSVLKAQLARLAFAQAGISLSRSHSDECEMTDQWVEYTQHGGVLTARAVYETQINIAVTRDALYQQGG